MKLAQGYEKLSKCLLLNPALNLDFEWCCVVLIQYRQGCKANKVDCLGQKISERQHFHKVYIYALLLEWVFKQLLTATVRLKQLIILSGLLRV